MALFIELSLACSTLPAVVTIPTPNGFVNTNTSPLFGVLFLKILSGCIVPVTLNPYFISLSDIEWPPVKIPPASWTLDNPPDSISPNILISSFSGKHTIFKAVLTVPPIAYMSLKAFAAAICPNI